MVAIVRRREAGLTGKSRGNLTTSLPEMRRSNVGLCLATILCRAQAPPGSPSSWAVKRGEVILREDLDYVNQTVASAQGVGQLEYYRLLEAKDEIRLVRTPEELDQLAARWARGEAAPIGCILSMEGCDPIVDPSQAEEWFHRGLRTACLAHYGPSAYAMGTGGDGPLTDAGRKLLGEKLRQK